MSTSKNSTIALDRNKRNQPSTNPFFEEIMAKSNADDPQAFYKLLSQAFTFEKAEVTFKFADVFKGRALAKKVGVSHETLYKRGREFAPHFIRKYTKIKGGAK